MLKKKSLYREEMIRIESKEVTIMSLDTKLFHGKVGLLEFKQLKSPLIVHNRYGDEKIADVQYKWLQFAPKDEHYWLTAMLNENDELFELYFDITKENHIDDKNPWFVDMELDVVIPCDEDAYIEDEDELLIALENGDITKAEYDIAYQTAHQIIEEYEKDHDLFMGRIREVYQMMRNQND